MEDNKTFTQEEVNSIIQDRLAKEKAKHEKQISDLQININRREKRLYVTEQLKQKGIPEELVDLVNLEDDESISNSITLLEKTYKQQHGTENKVYNPAGGNTYQEDPIRRAMGLSK